MHATVRLFFDSGGPAGTILLEKVANLAYSHPAEWGCGLAWGTGEKNHPHQDGDQRDLTPGRRRQIRIVTRVKKGRRSAGDTGPLTGNLARSRKLRILSDRN